MTDLHLTWLRYRHCPDSTGALCFVDGEFECYGCEDEGRSVKVAGETRIPTGRYEITLRDAGGMTERYRQKFPGMHRGMLWLRDVPGFEWVYIHIGNNESHTSGCLLVGLAPSRADRGEHLVWHSEAAYTRLYRKVVNRLVAGDRVWIEVAEL